MSVGIEGRIDLAGPVGKLLHRRPLKNGTVMQSFDMDPVSGDIFVTQLMSGGIQLTGESEPLSYAVRNARGDLCVTRLDRTGQITGHMYLRGFGHGVAMGVENRAGVVRLWTETGSQPTSDGKKGFGTAVTSFEFRSGAVLDHGSPLHTPPYRPGGTARYVTCTIDHSAGELVVRFVLDEVNYFERYDLAKAAAGVWEPLQRIPHPDPKGWFQGYTSHDGVLYMLSGMPIHPDYPENPPPGNTYLTAVDWATGAIVEQRRCVAAPGLEYREPEGMAVALREGVPHLYFGFAGEMDGARTCTIMWLSAAPETDGVKVLTDWQPITLAAGVTADQNSPRGRLISIAGTPTLQLSGGVKGTFDGDAVIGTLPDALTPTMTARAGVPRNNTGGVCVARVEASTDRYLRIYGGRDTNVITWAQLDGFSTAWC